MNNPFCYQRDHWHDDWKRLVPAKLLIFVMLFVMLLMQPVVALAADIRGDRTLTPPIINSMLADFSADHPNEAAKLKFVIGDEWTNGQAFGRGQCELLISIGQLSGSAGMRSIIAQASPDGNFIHWEEADIGQLRVVVLVNARNSIKELSFDQLQKLLSERWGLKTTWEDLGSKGGLVTCYGEHMESASREIIKERVMRYENRPEPGVPGIRISGTEEFRENIGLCFDANELIEAIAGDENGIGLGCYAGPLPKEVKPVAIMPETNNKKNKTNQDQPKDQEPQPQAVMPRIDTALQKDYPLAQPVLLHLHPQAGQPARVFFTWAQEKFRNSAATPQ